MAGAVRYTRNMPPNSTASGPSTSPVLFRDAQQVGQRLSGGAVAIGNFDGLHRGHQALFAAAIAVAPASKAGVLTFEPHPVRVLAPHFAPPQILSLEEKIAGIGAFGVDVVVVHPFDRDFASMAPLAFVDDVLSKWLKVKHVVVGEDFSFGRKGEGDIALLKDAFAKHGGEVTIVPPVTEGNLICSSTKVREFVASGNVEAARLVLGHPYWIAGVVERGDGRGRTIDVPTANLAVERDLKPKVGVYATWAHLPDGSTVPAVTNIGLRPTFEGETAPTVRIEAHLLDFDRDLYGQHLRLTFVGRLREEKKFSGRESLVEQIHRDIAAARKMLEEDASSSA